FPFILKCCEKENLNTNLTSESQKVTSHIKTQRNLMRELKVYRKGEIIKIPSKNSST
ncbi:hypothetical protein HHI36_002770, partial [Cryptolaemus montrouzieri]